MTEIDLDTAVKPHWQIVIYQDGKLYHTIHSIKSEKAAYFQAQQHALVKGRVCHVYKLDRKIVKEYKNDD